MAQRGETGGDPVEGKGKKKYELVLQSAAVREASARTAAPFCPFDHSSAVLLSTRICL